MMGGFSRRDAKAQIEDPIVGELFSVERLEQHARTLAAAQQVRPGFDRGRKIRPRVSENGRLLVEAYRTLAQAIKEERAVSPAAEWLVDNFPVVDEQIREIRDDLPADYYRELPKIADGHLAGYPRVLGVAWAYVAHTDSRFDPDSLRRMIAAYQEVETLTIGELWALAISLRIVLIENLRRHAERIVGSREARQRADDLADRLLGLGEGRTGKDNSDLRLRALEQLSTAGRVQLFQRLRDQDPATMPALGMLEELLATKGTTAEELVRTEHQSMATMNVTVRNVITSMRLISWFDWAEFVEQVGAVDAVLRGGSTFAALDFATRNRYRDAIEEMARGSSTTEVEVAQRAVELAAAHVGDDSDGSPSPRGDPGFFLIAEGRVELEQELALPVGFRQRLGRVIRRAAGPLYVAALAAVTALIIAAALLVTGDRGIGAVVVTILAVGPATELSVALVNRVVTRCVDPRSLPRLDLDDGIPPEMRTLVAVPMLLTSATDIDDQIDALEVHYLGSGKGDVWFALLSDWLDAETEHAEGDEELLSVAVAGVDRLNERYGPDSDGGARFLVLHRARRWNDREQCWMGWERKRGKLEEMNALLRGSSATSYLRTPARRSSIPPAGVRYVITLDADTRLPRSAVGQLVGTMAHPLNRPRFDPHVGRVTRGYGILQPRITPTLPAPEDASIYQRAYAGPAGVDPYALAVSDVYQDLFHEGSYTGKGIYEVDAFAGAMRDRVPDNALLSHDLFEGIFARAGLVSDIELFDDFPSNYLVDAARHHRWVRGDWQLLPWILGRHRPGRSGVDGGRGGVGLVGRWKMVDNLRRSLNAPLALATLVVAWTIESVSTGWWTLAVLLSMLIPVALPALIGLVPRRRDISKRTHLRDIGGDIAVAMTRALLSLAFLADQAWLMTDAVVRTLVRLTITRRHLLQWETAAHSKSKSDTGLAGYYRRMWGGVTLAVLVAVLVAGFGRDAAPVAAPLIALWLGAPLLALRVSRTSAMRPPEQLSLDQVETARSYARRTWHFFEEFVGEESNWLPPDNFQDDPTPVVATRTSPTNIGMYLLSAVTARDFGWLGTVEMAERLSLTLATVDRLERFHGHLYNWYDTGTLQRLEPEYVSTVDSGNLCGHLLAASNACRTMIDEPLPLEAARAGIGDALSLLRRTARGIGADRASQTLTVDHLHRGIEEFTSTLRQPVEDVHWPEQLRRLAELAGTLVDVASTLTAERGHGTDSELVLWAAAVQATVASHQRDLELLPALAEVDPATTLVEMSDDDHLRPSGAGSLAQLVRRLQANADEAHRLAMSMDFAWLFDPVRKLFSIGYRVRDGVLEPGYYDLLASEARLSSFVAIAKGDVTADHWFRLGRSLTPVGRGSALVSWSGSMFEYLMPDLVMRAPVGSILAQTARLVVARQIRYAGEQGIPWGISESGYSARDLEQTYQYAGFGIPGLGLKRGLGEDLVVAPYATGLAAMIEPSAAIRNLERLEALGALGRYGFREALDFTARRVPADEPFALVKSYMAHHQGMLLVALGNVVNDFPLVERFHAEPIVEATELVLHERMPRNALVARPRAEEVTSDADVRDAIPPMLRMFSSPHDAIPRSHLLSNGRYTVMVSAAGSGFSRWRDLAVTRWREDVTRDPWGSYVYLRDTASGDVWSAGHQPTGREADRYEVVFSEEAATITRRDGSILTTLKILVSAEDNAEIRRVSLTNLGAREREIELTSYQELAMAPQAADEAHPAFQNLFVQTEFVPDVGALIATRRPRSPDDPSIWVAHVATIDGRAGDFMQFETDRARFLGRGRSVRNPVSVIGGRPLSNTVGAVLDPILSGRCRVAVPAGETVHVVFVTAVADARDQVLDLADKYRNAGVYDRAQTLAWTHAQVQLHHIGVDAAEAQVFQRLANRVIYSDPSLRPTQGVLLRNERGAPSLWSYGISGDLPIVVVRIDEAEDLGIVRQLLRAHEYWGLKRLAVDLVIINEHGPAYAQDLQLTLESLARTSQAILGHEAHGGHGNVYVLRGERLSAEDRTLLLSAARAVLLSRHGSLAQQVIRLESAAADVASASPAVPDNSRHHPPPLPQLEFFNGLGGFGDDGREYVTVLGPGQTTPAPWINVVANRTFGFQVSESGSGFTWSENSRENQLTPWANDPVTDGPGEVIYLGDEDSGTLWTPTAQPIRRAGSTYVARHGAGYSRFEVLAAGIQSELTQFVALDESLKVSVLSLENRSRRPRRLTVTAYAEWVLGTSRGASAPRVITEHDEDSGALLARNPWNTEFGGRVAFLDLGGRQQHWTADRTAFLGRNGDLERPAALAPGRRLVAAAGAGLDPCAALQTRVELAAGERTEIVVLLGEADGIDEARDLIRRARGADHRSTLGAIQRWWGDVLGGVEVRTPDRSMDLLLNRWLLYQALACRLWARAALYQAGGAYGFRDQLQDVIALLVSQPALAREHLLRAAAHQFVEGDVQHWWHPPSGRGVRTHISDDRLWLPYVVDRYLAVTGDAEVLDERVPYLQGPPLAPGQADAYFQPEVAHDGTLFEHCVAAIERSLALGAHGLPLMGAGDWNDGMNRVGHLGRGESVWLGWFLHRTLAGFIPIAESRGEHGRAEAWRGHLERLRESLERHGWDGDWYRRAYFDDGTPLGAASNDECRIDSIAQSWSVLSKVAPPARAARAMAAVDEYLVRRGDGLVVLFTPAFDHGAVDPGYIKGYVPGVRENGGQYTHGAIWSVIAFALLGEGNKAGELFSILNPINHASTRAGVYRYKVEPYVMAADVYAEHPHSGRGGWTWYTGAAGWMYQAGMESILGFRLRNAELIIDPCIPTSWPGYELRFRYHSSAYEIVVENPHAVSRGVQAVELDGEPLDPERGIPLQDDGSAHRVRVVLGNRLDRDSETATRIAQ